jgi:ribonuclease VapC
VILDSSAIISILTDEAGADRLLEKLSGAEALAVGAPTLVETSIVLTSRIGPGAHRLLERFLQELGAAILPFSESHWHIAAETHQRFGKGHHPAALNFGDCLAYATARLSAQPLLCIGDDFNRTDLELA